MDWRNIIHGDEIPKEGYCDQPYVVQTADNHWLCVLTTGPGVEGHFRQHVLPRAAATTARPGPHQWILSRLDHPSHPG